MLELLQHVETIAKQAGQNILLPAFESQLSSQTKKSDGSIVTETDEKAQQFIEQELRKINPKVGFLGEEMDKNEQLSALHEGNAFWCVDPLDGTGNFTTPLPLFAVSIALVEYGKPTLACIYDPVRDEIFSAYSGSNILLNGKVLQHTNTQNILKDSVGFVDFKRLQPKLATRLASEKLYRSQRNLGSCALEWAWLAAGRGQFIIHGGEKLWDYAAGLLLAEESGCVVTNFLGKHPFAKSQLSSSIVATSNQLLSEQWLNITKD
ncbi:MAG: inositol monophosphatase family protein [Ghiorsea sp.]